MSNATIRQNMEKLAEENKIRIVDKESSWMMRTINRVIGWFNKTFMDGFVTTIGDTIYFPKEMLENNYSVWSILPHEMRHGQQFQKLTLVGAALIYLFPQWLALGALLSILAIWDISFLWCLTFLIFLLPWPAPGRKWMEMEGYALTLLVLYEDRWHTGDLEVPEYIVRQFTGPNYYFMWPFKSRVRAELDGLLKMVEDGSIDKKFPLAKEVRKIIREGLDEDE